VRENFSLLHDTDASGIDDQSTLFHHFSVYFGDRRNTTSATRHLDSACLRNHIDSDVVGRKSLVNLDLFSRSKLWRLSILFQKHSHLRVAELEASLCQVFKRDLAPIHDVLHSQFIIFVELAENRGLEAICQNLIVLRKVISGQLNLSMVIKPDDFSTLELSDVE